MTPVDLAVPRGGSHARESEKPLPDFARAQRDAAHRIADCVLREARVERVVIGALHGELGTGWEVRSR